MKKIAALFCMILLMFTLVSCVGNQETPKQAVTNALTAVKNSDSETAQQYFNYNDLVKNDSSEDEILEDEEILKLMFKKFDFKILSSEVKGDNATVKTEITNIDLRPVIGEYVKEAFSLAMSDMSSKEDDLDKEMEKVFIDLLSNEDNKLLTSVVDVKLRKVEGKWKLDMDEKLQDAILGGFISIADDLDDGSNIDDESELNEESLELNATIIEKEQSVAIEEYCEFTIKNAEFTKKVVPPNPDSFYSYYEAKEPGTVYLDTVVTIKNLLETGKTSDEFISVKVIYNNKYEYTTFSAIEEEGGSDFTYTNITSIEPLKNGTLHFIAEVPDEVESGPVFIVVTVNGQDYKYNVK